MAAITIPQNQNLYPTPNEHINFNFENSIEEYRTARYLNNILKIFGPDTFLWGLDLTNVTWLSDNEISLSFNKGSLIQDSTLIKVLYSFDKTLNNLTPTTISQYNLIVYTDFKFEPVTTQVTSNPQQFVVKLAVHDPITGKIYSNNPDETELSNIGGLSFIDSVNQGFYFDQVIEEPINIQYNGSELTKNTDVSTLSENEWGFGDQDNIGENRIYVRLLEDVNPSTLLSNELQYLFLKNLINWDIVKNKLIFHCAPFTKPEDAIYSINIEGYTYISRGTRQNPSANFNYETIESFNLDGGVI